MKTLEKKDVRFVRPRVTVTENDKEYAIYAEVPGVTLDQLKIEIANSVLTIHAEAGDEKTQGARIISERAGHNYHREFTLDDTVDQENTKASLRNGVLTLTLGKKAEALPKTISITEEA
ncbi:MAG: Hsp20/alpha crystallin family protein [Candidatus Auribacterota bacterium]